jgi:hypothetical protein
MVESTWLHGMDCLMNMSGGIYTPHSRNAPALGTIGQKSNPRSQMIDWVQM